MKKKNLKFFCLLENIFFSHLESCCSRANPSNDNLSQLFTFIGGLESSPTSTWHSRIFRIDFFCASAHFSIIINFAKILKSFFLCCLSLRFQVNETFNIWRSSILFSSLDLSNSLLWVFFYALLMAPLQPRAFPRTRVIVCFACWWFFPFLRVMASY